VFPLPFTLKNRYRSPAHQLAAVTRDADAISETLDITKWALRQAFAPDLPDVVVNRPKVGFPVPLGSWLNRGLVDFTRSVLTDHTVRSLHVFDAGAVDRLLGDASDERDALRVWMLANIGLFLEQYFG